MGWQDDSAHKGTHYQSLTSEFSPHGGKEEPTSTSCSLNSTHAHLHIYSTHTIKEINMVINKLMFYTTIVI